MNREVKFRGQKIDTKEWICGYLFGIWEQTYILWGTTNGIPNMIEVIPGTVGQCTELRDKSDRDIYEGDILNCGDRIVMVKWNIHCGQWDSNFIRYDGKKNSNGIINADWQYRAEIIGNIHDNPELLEAR